MDSQNTFFYFISEYTRITSTSDKTEYFAINTKTNQKILLLNTCRFQINTVGLKLNDFFCYSIVITGSQAQPNYIFSVSSPDFHIKNDQIHENLYEIVCQ